MGVPKRSGFISQGKWYHDALLCGSELGPSALGAHKYRVPTDAQISVFLALSLMHTFVAMTVSSWKIAPQRLLRRVGLQT